MTAVFWDCVGQAAAQGAPDVLVSYSEFGRQAGDSQFFDAFAETVTRSSLPLVVDAPSRRGPDEAATLRVRFEAGGDWSVPASMFSEEAVAASVTCGVARVRAWVQDVIVDSKVCPFTASPDRAGTGLEAAGVTPGPVLWPTSVAEGSGPRATVDLCRDFWRAVVDLLSAPPEEASTTLLVAPLFAVGDHGGFLRAMDLIVDSLKLVRGDDDVALVFFHPDYDRDDPALRQDRPIHGHLPPSAWLRAYLKLAKSDEEIASLTDDDLRKSLYQRRAPCTTINILRADQVDKAEAFVPSMVIEPTPGRRIRVSGAKVYAANTWRLAAASERRVDALGYEYLAARGGRRARGASMSASS